MNVMFTVMGVSLFLMALGFGLWLFYMEYEKRKRADDPGIDVSYLRPPAVINTYEFGPVVAEHFEWETNTSGHATVHDANGRLRTLSPVHLEELRPRNMFQVVFGPGPAEFDWVPRGHAQREQQRFAAHADSVADAINYKHKFDMAQTDAIVERENTTLELEKAVERAQALLKAQPTAVKR